MARISDWERRLIEFGRTGIEHLYELQDEGEFPADVEISEEHSVSSAIMYFKCEHDKDLTERDMEFILYGAEIQKVFQELVESDDLKATLHFNDGNVDLSAVSDLIVIDALEKKIPVKKAARDLFLKVDDDLRFKGYGGALRLVM